MARGAASVGAAAGSRASRASPGAAGASAARRQAPAAAASAAARASLAAAVLLGGGAAAQGNFNCEAFDQEVCLTKPGCHWFAREANAPCALCDRWFGDQVSVTGCRDWSASTYCGEYVAAAAEAHGANLADPAVQEAVGHYEVIHGMPEPGNPQRKRRVCSIWCDASPPFSCTGQPRAKAQVKGVNYGGRFVPEAYLSLAGTEELFAGAVPPAGRSGGSPSLCDVAAMAGGGGAADRMAAFLDRNIQEAHFARMAASGFNVVRLPLGYWNLIQLPPGVGPNGDSASAARWIALQGIMSPARYAAWIDRVFDSARAHGLQVLLDLHGAPGGQSDNPFTGCDQGCGRIYFDTAWNKALATHAIEEMAAVCARHGETCYGLELLNEPSGAEGPAAATAISRESLADFYQGAIKAARRHLPPSKPLVIMEWTAWLPWWMARPPLSYAEYGNVMFSTHLYYMGPTLEDQAAARATFAHDLEVTRDFYEYTPYDMLVTEYAFNNHGTGGSQDVFDYNSMASWFVNHFNEHGSGSFVWNYDAGAASWGPVAACSVGAGTIDWSGIFAGRAPAGARKARQQPQRQWEFHT